MAFAALGEWLDSMMIPVFFSALNDSVILSQARPFSGAGSSPLPLEQCSCTKFPARNEQDSPAVAPIPYLSRAPERGWAAAAGWQKLLLP